MLQNGIILLIFQNMKNPKYGFCCISCEFYYHDITVAPFVNDNYYDVTTESIP